MAWIRTVGDEEAVGPLAKHYRAALSRAGRVFGIVRLHSLDPVLLGASMRLYRATTTAEDLPLTRAQRELIAVVTSKANDCFY
jgi:alkylhydroperoxidase family enzyme